MIYENLPTKSGKTLYKNDVAYEVVLIDATETPIERPKKNRSTTTQEKRKGIHLRPKSWSTKQTEK
jgi:hypothetical protein